MRRKHGVSDATVYEWQAKYGGMVVSEAKRLKGWKTRTPAAKRQAVAHLVASHEMSERRACRVIGCRRMTMRYEVVRRDNPLLREWLKELAQVCRRFGYRRLHVFLQRENHEVNHKRLLRIYCEEQLHVRRRGGRKRATGTDGADAEPTLVAGLRVQPSGRPTATGSG